MLSDVAISFNQVSKIYKKGSSSHGALRDDILSFLSFRKKKGLNSNEFYALKDFSFKVNKGECIGLYGPNGSGKSTLLKLIANVIVPNSGEIKVNGRIAPLIELGAGFHPDLTGIENIYMNGAILGMKIKEIRSKIDHIVEYSGLSDFISTPVKKYSSGMKLRLGFSVAIHSEAEIFLFDEVLAVGDDDFKKKSADSIQEIVNEDKTLLIVSHNKEKLSSLTDKIVFLEKGKMLS